jgi:hypothetical protein
MVGVCVSIDRLCGASSCVPMLLSGDAPKDGERVVLAAVDLIKLERFVSHIV